MAGGHQIIAIALDERHAGWRLDRALADALPSLSRERLKVLVKSGALSAGPTL
ncbi:MAG TPA: RluA family pseudouridine synthase, partial [Sphingomicrobium sp.]|nr:RluA family pseudouridine synthase [Sphingomicrobium sp.]